MRANARAIASSEARAQHREELHPCADLGERAAQQALRAQPLAELVVDLDPVPAEVAA